MSPISPELVPLIQRHVNDLPEGFEAWPVSMCKEKLNALPLHGDQIYLWALRPDGVVLCLDHESASLPVWEESDPLTLYAVLVRGAQQYPDLQELVPPRPLGVQQCEPCSGSGMKGVGQTAEGCMRCRGLGWHVTLRPIGEWIERIDRGDQLRLRAAGRVLIAGRLAGLYMVVAGDDYWSTPSTSPTAAAARQHLRARLASFQAGKDFDATWRESIAGMDDPFEHTEYTLVFHGSGTGGSYTVEFTRQPDGDYLETTTLNNDWDPLGSGPPDIRTEWRSETEARAEIENRMRRGGFPAVVKRE
jgi:hypothetical protein